MRYKTLEAWLKAGLADTEWHDIPMIHGPNDDPEVTGRCVILTRDGGAGLWTEEALIDEVGYQFRCVGEQRDPDDAEALALALDSLVRSGGRTGPIVDGNGARLVQLVSAQRFGGPPIPLMVDDAHRHHYVCSYLFSTPSE